MTDHAMARPSYTVKNIELVAEGSDVRARRYTWRPARSSLWHYHSWITSWYFCLGGSLRDRDTRIARRRVVRGGPKLQGIGTYDFNKIQT